MKVDGEERASGNAAAREAARQTAAKIDQIENEMIADALSTIGKPRKSTGSSSTLGADGEAGPTDGSDTFQRQGAVPHAHIGQSARNDQTRSHGESHDGEAVGGDPFDMLFDSTRGGQDETPGAFAASHDDRASSSLSNNVVGNEKPPDFNHIPLDTVALEGGSLPRAPLPAGEISVTVGGSLASGNGIFSVKGAHDGTPFGGLVDRVPDGSRPVGHADPDARFNDGAETAGAPLSFDDLESFDDPLDFNPEVAHALNGSGIIGGGGPGNQGINGRGTIGAGEIGGASNHLDAGASSSTVDGRRGHAAVSGPSSGTSASGRDGVVGPAAARVRPGTIDDLAIDVTGGSLPGQLEEAAILYSNGQHEPTVDALKLAVEDGRLSAAHKTLAWQMLFDLYRVMGERDSFDSLAIRYASVTESSPPAWSDDLRYPERRDPNRRKASPSHVIAAGDLDASIRKYVEQLTRAATHKRDCSLDFTELNSLDADAAIEIIRLVDVFREQQHALTLLGLEKLYAVARSNIESGRRDDDERFWQLALLTLRLIGDQSRFEDLSIEYCVTYEVSPPPWQPMPSYFTQADAGAKPHPVVAANTDEAPKPVLPDDRVVFSGDLTGKILSDIKALRLVAQNHDLIMVDCRKLRRVDFVAAGELLNELMKLQGAGRTVQFVEPNFLVYALMLVMGIHDMAQIRRRKL